MKLLTLELAGMLEFGGFIHPDPDDDMLCRVGYLCDLINARVSSPAASGNVESLSVGSTESGRESTGGGEGLTALIASVMEDADCYAQTAAEYGSRFEARTERECLEENLRSAIATSTQGQAKESGNG